MKAQLVNILIAIVIVSVLSFGISAVINNKPEVIKETADTIYVKRYNVYNTRIDTISYPQPQIYNGVIIDKNKHVYKQGIPGKGGHWVYKYYITIEYNEKTFRHNDRMLYDKYVIGDTLNIKESWYPHHTIKIY